MYTKHNIKKISLGRNENFFVKKLLTAIADNQKLKSSETLGLEEDTPTYKTIIAKSQKGKVKNLLYVKI